MLEKLSLVWDEDNNGELQSKGGNSVSSRAAKASGNCSACWVLPPESAGSVPRNPSCCSSKESLQPAHTCVPAPCSPWCLEVRRQLCRSAAKA